MVGALVKVDLVSGVNADTKDPGMKTDSTAGIKDSFAEIGAGPGHAALNRSDQRCGADVRKEIQTAAFQEYEIAAAFGLQLDSAVGVKNAQTKLSDIEAGPGAYDLYGWMFEVIRGLAFQCDVMPPHSAELAMKDEELAPLLA